MIPKDFYFIWFCDQEYEVGLLHYLAMKSCLVNNAPCRVTLLCNNEPTGGRWTELSPHINVVVDSDIEGPDYRAVSNAKRFELLKQGGVYCDLDVLIFAPIPDQLFESGCVACEVGFTKKPLLNSCLIMADAGSQFLQFWAKKTLDRIEVGSPSGATVLEHGVDYVGSEPGLVTVGREAFFMDKPNGASYRDFFLKEDFDLGNTWGIHLWGSFSRSRRFPSPAEVLTQYPEGFFAQYAKEIIEATI